MLISLGIGGINKLKLYLTHCGGTRAIAINFLKYSFCIVPIIIGDWKLRKHFKPRYLQHIFKIYRNRRNATNEWDLDVVIFGIMFQFQKYKPFMLA